MADKQDYYATLGVERSADADAIKKAYRALAKKYHPDMNPGDKAAEQKFKEINEAYSVLSDPDKKAKYDQYGHAAFEGGGAGGAGGFDFGDFGGFGDIFSSFFGGGSSAGRNGPIRGDDVYARIAISFEDSFKGCKRDITFNRVQKCADCNGSGAAPGTSPETCPVCHGSGQQRVSQRTPFGMMQSTRVCDNCRGTGKIVKTPCAGCRGTGYVKITKTLSVSIPAGIDDDNRIALRSEGNAGRNGGPNGDLILSVIVRPSPIFERSGPDVFCEVPISFPEATLGAEIDIPTLEGNEKYHVPEGTQPGTTFTLRGRGMPILNSRGRGDLHITVNVEVPKSLNHEQRDLLTKFADSCGDNNYQKKTGFFKKFIGKDKR